MNINSLPSQCQLVGAPLAAPCWWSGNLWVRYPSKGEPECSDDLAPIDHYPIRLSRFITLEITHNSSRGTTPPCGSSSKPPLSEACLPHLPARERMKPSLDSLRREASPQCSPRLQSAGGVGAYDVGSHRSSRRQQGTRHRGQLHLQMPALHGVGRARRQPIFERGAVSQDRMNVEVQRLSRRAGV
jgi:hypothetical protein